jgi:tRNA threonylcarbamoyladenosine biosynthesis protein TsaE
MAFLDELRAGRTTATAEETMAVAEQLAALLTGNVTLALHGNLGVGKTTFVQGLAKAFGVRECVTSPTFNIYTAYRAPGRTLVHLDAYRLDNARQVEDLLLEDFLTPPWCLAIEWPEKIAEWIAADAMHLELGIAPDERHTIRLR